MAREYVVSSSNITIAGATTLISLRPTSTQAIEILRMWVSQSGTLAITNQRVRVNYQTGTVGTFTGATPQKLKVSDPPCSITSGTAQGAGSAGINASVENGTKTTVFEDAFNVLNGWLWVATPRETLIVPAAGSALGLDFPTAPATLTGWAFGITFAEIG
jgi:hypothetical protein